MERPRKSHERESICQNFRTEKFGNDMTFIRTVRTALAPKELSPNPIAFLVISSSLKKTRFSTTSGFFSRQLMFRKPFRIVRNPSKVLACSTTEWSHANFFRISKRARLFSRQPHYVSTHFLDNARLSEYRRKRGYRAPYRCSRFYTAAKLCFWYFSIFHRQRDRSFVRNFNISETIQPRFTVRR